MFKRLREQFSTAALVVSAIALLFAMLGGAYAASNSAGGGKATASAKGKPGPRGPRGKTGPAGPAGPQGLPGTNGTSGLKGDPGIKGETGDQGLQGEPGDDGEPGKSVEAFPIAAGPTDAVCNEQGGTEFEVEGSGHSSHVCNGKDGEDGSGGGGTLGEGETESGTWSFHGTTADVQVEGNPGVLVPITFQIPLASGLGSTEVQFGTGNGCNGSVGSPTVVNNTPGSFGRLCIYTNGGELLHATPGEIGDPTFGSVGTGTTGAEVSFTITANPGFGYGSWALAGPKAP